MCGTSTKRRCANPEYRLSRYIDLNQSLPDLEAAVGDFPAEALAIRNEPVRLTGAWYFTDRRQTPTPGTLRETSSSRGSAWHTGLTTRRRYESVYARYAVPPVQERDSLGILGSHAVPGIQCTDGSAQSGGGRAAGLHRADPFPSGGEHPNPLVDPPRQALRHLFHRRNERVHFLQPRLECGHQRPDQYHRAARDVEPVRNRPRRCS